MLFLGFLVILLLSIPIGLGILFSPLPQISSDNLFFPLVIDGLFLAPGLAILAVTIWLVFRVRRNWVYGFEFQDTFLATHTPEGMPSALRFECAYADIVAVRRSSPGIIEIVPRRGKALTALPHLLAEGEAAFFDALEEHVPAGRIEPGLRENFDKLGPMQKVLIVLQLLAGLLMILTTLLLGSTIIFPLPLGWTQFGPWTQFPEYISGFTIESPNSVWVARHTFPLNDVYVEHIRNGQAQSWQLSGKQMGEFDFLHNLVLADAKQEPVLIAHHSLYSLNNGAWQRQAYPDGYSGLDGLTTASARSSEGWMVLSGFKRPSQLVHVQAGDPVPQKVDLPGTVGQADPSQVRTLTDGTVLVQAANVIYVLRNGAWQKQDYPLERKDELYIRDFTLADDGNAYVLLWRLDKSEGFIVRIDPQGHQLRTQIPALTGLETTGDPSYTSLVIDARGRVWVAGGVPDFVRVFEPAWGGVAREIVEYDEYNSNYQEDFENGLLRTADGRIWAAHNRLIWIDSNAADLPAPLPRWLARLRQPGGQLPFLILAVLMSATSIVLSIVILWRNRINRKTGYKP